MKIKRVEEIKNFSIFKNFDWEANLTYQNKQNQSEVYDFKDINILYGRNYSGKTSLSKIIRTLEKKKLPQKYDNPNFRIKLQDESEITQSTLSSFQHPIHIYNSDFVRENLKFIHNEDENIESFSVTLGGDNQQILDRLQELKNELGSNEECAEIGLYLSIKNKNNEVRTAIQNHSDKNSELLTHLTRTASGHQDSIRRQPRFGDSEYTITKLRREIDLVSSHSYTPLEDTNKNLLESLINQRTLQEPPIVSSYNLNFLTFIQSADEILRTIVGSTSKIEELVNNSILNVWVQTGHQLHQDRTTCAFCNNPYEEKRRQEIAAHFDQQTTMLQSRIRTGIQHLENQLLSPTLNINFDISNYYEQFHEDLNQLKADLITHLEKQKNSIQQLKKSLEEKNSHLFTEMSVQYPEDFSQEIRQILERVSTIRNECIALNTELATRQKDAKDALRLNHIYHFLNTINYTQRTAEIELALQAIAPLNQELETLNTRKDTIIAEIKSEENKLKSEGEACTRIKNILKHDFGHQALSLEPIEINTTNGKEIKFEIQRHGTKAHNLSEGEQSLISFCYFLAKIQDDLDEDKKPIIWIDDPICSLDNNHIYFIYSLLENLCLDNKYGQLFVSTHNLDFLKYLTQLTAMGKTEHTLKRERAFYQIEKTFLGSTVKKMAYHLEQNSSEFIYLFDLIYKCSLANEVDDSNHIYFYNFANNARKFLEIYTYYLFPNPALKDRQRLQLFWGDRLPRIFSERINHDGSHAVTILEGKITLRDFSEINTNAKLILAKLKECNPIQYSSLLESIGITPFA